MLDVSQLTQKMTAADDSSLRKFNEHFRMSQFLPVVKPPRPPAARWATNKPVFDVKLKTTLQIIVPTQKRLKVSFKLLASATNFESSMSTNGTATCCWA
jgi:hypothetical protein